MRVALLLLVLAAASCGRNRAEPPPQRGSSSEVSDEQARFDADRKPEKLVEAMAIGPGSKVADVGAGSGLITVHLARAVAPSGKVVATDIDGSVLDLLKQRLEAAGLGNVVERRVVAADAPGLDEGGYDAILLAEVDHYFPDPVKWLTSAAHALVPGGRIVISNRIYHRAQTMDAARKAGLVLKSETNPVPTHFVAVFVVEPK
jgi:ubiquinone/menaquinone biosynthesis C-methylase UbiE